MVDFSGSVRGSYHGVAQLTTADVEWAPTAPDRHFAMNAGTASVVGGSSAFARVAASATLCVGAYLLLVIALHRGIEPIARLIDLLRDMVPRRPLRAPATAAVSNRAT